MEIEKLKEEIRQQKVWEDLMRCQINRRLKLKTEDFKKLYRDHKQMEAEHKKLASDYNHQYEKLKEARTDDDRDDEVAGRSGERTNGAHIAALPGGGMVEDDFGQGANNLPDQAS